MDYTNNIIYQTFVEMGKGCSYFVETGTHEGGAVRYALDAGFEKIFSCEMMKERYDICVSKFKDNDNVYLWNGLSSDVFPEILKKVDKRSLFWLDAHAEGGGVPTMEELDMISELSEKNHNILIDDVPVYFGDGESLKESILKINQNYKFKWFDTARGNYILGAYCD